MRQAGMVNHAGVAGTRKKGGIRMQAERCSWSGPTLRNISKYRKNDEVMECFGNELEALKGDHSIRVRGQWGAAYCWDRGNFFEVQKIDRH